MKKGSKWNNKIRESRIMRGNAWGLTPNGLECAFRTNGPPDYFHLSVGFRYCFDYKPKKD